jgi:polyisoprenoid-binding protein YceI
MDTTQTTQAEARTLPPAGIWTVDPTHSQLQFVVRHMMISKIRGRFRDFSGTIEIGERPEDSWLEAVIQAASIDTGDEQRDAHLRSPEFLYIERYPVITYRSTSVRAVDDRHAEVVGELALRDVVKPITLKVEFSGTVQGPWGNLRAGFMAATEINRDDFGVTWNQALEAGGWAVGKVVTVEVDAEAVLHQPSGS